MKTRPSLMIRARSHTLERLGDVVIGDQHALAELFFQAAHFALQIFDGDRIDAAEGFVEQDQLGIGDRGSAEISSLRRSPPLRVSAR